MDSLGRSVFPMTTKELWLEIKPYFTRKYVSVISGVSPETVNKALCGGLVGTESEAKVVSALRILREDLDKRLNRKK